MQRDLARSGQWHGSPYNASGSRHRDMLSIRITANVNDWVCGFWQCYMAWVFTWLA